MSRQVWAILAALAAVLVVTPAVAQTDSLTIEDVDDSEYPDLELTVTVPSALESVALPADSFVVSEDGEVVGRPRLGRSATVGEAPTPRVVLAIDVSGSMANPRPTGGGRPIDLAKDAAADFVRELRSGTEVAIVAFGDEPDVVQSFTTDEEVLLARLASITADTSAQTALFDGVTRAAEQLARGRVDVPRSIVLLSDGGDTASSGGLTDARGALEESGAALWAVGLESDEFDPGVLRELAGDGGRVVSASDAEQLEGIYVGLASDLSRQYLVRYRSNAGGETTIGLALSYGVVRASTSMSTTIDGTPTTDPREVTSVSRVTPYVVTLPLLATTPSLVAGLVALVIALVALVWILTSTPRASAGRRLQDFAAGVGHTRSQLSSVAEWVTDQADRRLRDRRLGGSIDRALEQAGLELRTGEFAVLVTSASLVAYAMGLVLANAVVGFLLAAIVPIAARLFLSIRRDRRQAAFADQFIDVLQLIASSLRAGYGLLQGIDAVARDAQEPAASEFRRILVEHRLGRDLTDAMDNCAVRMGNDDFGWVVQAIGIHRDIGGDLARVLDNIVSTVRERTAVHRQVRALSAEGRMSAWVLTALPFVTATVIAVVNPGYLGTLTSRPVGLVMLAVAAIMLLLGTVVIRRMVKIRY
jgi:tight adherence protein B